VTRSKAATQAPEGGAAMALPAVGEVLNGRYQVEGVLGRGAFGVVLRARDRVSDTVVALKLLSAGQGKSPEAMARAGGRDQPHSLGRSIGHAAYMAPEQLVGRRDVGPPADMYSLGLVLFEAATGTHTDEARAELRKLLAAWGHVDRSVREVADARRRLAELH
jgi:hypothetical protein